MSVDKRHSTEDPLTEHDVAERLSHAMLRVWRILTAITDDPVLHEAVKHSRFLVVQPYQLIEALEAFDKVKEPNPLTLTGEYPGGPR